ncbi:MAG TPA: hypothetical protein VL588_09590, partial [Bdellovibrionota bacterium]|nr:hypothetical protein [Bdellovibrionota bacterium]
MSRQSVVALVAATAALTFSATAIAGGKKPPSRAAWAASLTEALAPSISPPSDSIWNPPLLKWMSERSKEPFTAGNKLTLLQDGGEFYPRRQELIQSAHTSIDI